MIFILSLVEYITIENVLISAPVTLILVVSLKLHGTWSHHSFPRMLENYP